MLAIFDLLGWGAATISTIGLVAAGLVFLAGRLMFVSSKRREGRQPSFLGPLTYEVPRSGLRVVDPFVERPAHERRCHFRREGNPTQVAIGHVEDPSELARGVVVDRSTGGICLEMLTPLAVGAVVSVRPSVGTTRGAWVEAEVRNCRRARDGWHVGFRFVRTPPLSVLWMFG